MNMYDFIWLYLIMYDYVLELMRMIFYKIHQAGILGAELPRAIPALWLK